MLSRATQCARSSYTHLFHSGTYVSARSYASSLPGRNGEIVQLLNECIKKEENSEGRNGYKLRAFRNAIRVIEKFDGPILDSKDVKNVAGIGEGIAGRIACFLASKEHHESDKPVEINKTNQRAKAIALISSIPGIGIKKAATLVDDGCDTIEKLRLPQYYKKLSKFMSVSLDHFELLGTTLSRQQAEHALDFCRTFLRFGGTIHLAGSYRRGDQELSCLEFLVVGNSDSDVPHSRRAPTIPLISPVPKKRSRPAIPFYQSQTSIGDREASQLLKEVIDPLSDLGILSGSLNSSAFKWQGWLRIPSKSEDNVWENRLKRQEGVEAQTGTFIRADFNFAPIGSKGGALLLLTGDDEFVSDIQSRASKLGLNLNEYGLWKLDSANDSSDSENKWTLVEGRDEEAILKEIGMEYVDPEKRNFAFVVDSRKSGYGKKKIQI